ncbi:conserved hypothetical protein [Methanococcus vannielii SB]|uniref:DUF2304 domain-containing protein n=1 Tax=Methanococcus vannielii (strain ATCC 35089 / DSM 1224 / JCM 13029 / OCM 148 / SB) TaxID=406327 RepID=A6UQU1_METVS|nr:DUF2304 domain-containing protein [Methanococcus vannielii]ABR54863.1 conserved hypothetical protein [Methanococcus vannielii SB]
MELVQNIGIFLGILAILKLIKQAKKSSISPFVAILWAIFGITILFMIVFPKYLSYIAKPLGIDRGIDVLVYFGIIALFFLLYKTYVKTEHLEREITGIISEIAIRDRFEGKSKRKVE